MRWTRSLFAAFVLCLLCSFAMTGSVQAQTTADANFNLTTSPVFVSLATPPNQTVSTPIRVQNNAQKAVRLEVKLMKFKAYGLDGEARLLEPEPNDPSVSWVKFSTTSFEAQPQAWNTVTMTVSPSPAAAFGYYYAVVFKQAGTPDRSASNNTISGSSAVLVLLDVQVPGAKRQLEVTSFKPKHRIFEFLPAEFEISVKNTGNVHVVPTGDIFINRHKGDNIGTVPLNDVAGNVLPGSSRNFTLSWDDGYPAHIKKRVGGQVVSDKNGKPVYELSWDSSKINKFRFGKYTAHLLLVYNNGKQDVPVESEVTFWVIPWKIMLVLLVILLLVLFGLWTILRKVSGLRQKLARVHNRPKS